MHVLDFHTFMIILLTTFVLEKLKSRVSSGSNVRMLQSVKTPFSSNLKKVMKNHFRILSLYLKLIHVGDFKRSEEVMSTMYQYSFNLIRNTTCLFWPRWYSGAPSGDYDHSDTWLEGSPPQISYKVPLMNRLALICYLE